MIIETFWDLAPPKWATIQSVISKYLLWKGVHETLPQKTCNESQRRKCCLSWKEVPWKTFFIFCIRKKKTTKNWDFSRTGSNLSILQHHHQHTWLSTCSSSGSPSGSKGLSWPWNEAASTLQSQGPQERSQGDSELVPAPGWTEATHPTPCLGQGSRTNFALRAAEICYFTADRAPPPTSSSILSPPSVMSGFPFPTWPALNLLPSQFLQPLRSSAPMSSSLYPILESLLSEEGGFRDTFRTQDLESISIRDSAQLCILLAVWHQTNHQTFQPFKLLSEGGWTWQSQRTLPTLMF